MEAIEFVRSYYFSTVYYFTFLVLVWGTVLYYIGSSSQRILRSEGSPMQGAAFLLTIVAIFFLGLRPISRADFGDMWLYSLNYESTLPGAFVPIGFSGEWLWDDIAVMCQTLGFNSNEYFLVIEFGYIGFMFVSAVLLMRKNLWLAMLFSFISFSFYTFGTNGIRNGLACSIELVALALVVESGPKRVLGFLFMFFALGIHRSTMLPSAAALMTIYMVKDTKTAIRFWLASIVISLLAGPYVEQLMVSIGFDDRVEAYYRNQFDESIAASFSHTGFRWDFLLYSSFPVLMIWYVTRYRKFTEIGYTMFANSYLLANAFWIMVIRASFSNRFAYLSWFLYPVVIAYPLLRMNLWKDQDRKTAIILFLYSGFTFFMFFIYYFGTSGFRGFDQYWWL